MTAFSHGAALAKTEVMDNRTKHRLILTFFSLSLIILSAGVVQAGSSQLLGSLPGKTSCQGRNVNTDVDYGVVQLHIENGADPLVFVEFNDPALNFNIGRSHSAGRNYSASEGYECLFVEAADGASLLYACELKEFMPKTMTYMAARNISARSSVAQSGTQFRICKHQNFCVDLRACSSAR